MLIGVIGFPLLTLLLTAGRSNADLATALSSYLVLVVVVAATGGVWPAALAAIAGFLLSNYYFTPPVHTFTIADARDILALRHVPGHRRRGERPGRPVAPAGPPRPSRPAPTPGCWPGWPGGWWPPRAIPSPPCWRS